jgi:DNA-directed RNA polymerase subunit RPC12/RpoP
MSPPSKGPRRPKKCINCKTPITQNKHGGIRLFCETCGRPARLMAEKRAKVPDERPTECRDCGTPIEQPRRGVRICCTDCGRKRDMEYQADYHKTWREKHPEKVAGYNEAGGGCDARPAHR